MAPIFDVIISHITLLLAFDGNVCGSTENNNNPFHFSLTQCSSQCVSKSCTRFTFNKANSTCSREVCNDQNSNVPYSVINSKTKHNITEVQISALMKYYSEFPCKELVSSNITPAATAVSTSYSLVSTTSTVNTGVIRTISDIIGITTNSNNATATIVTSTLTTDIFVSVATTVSSYSTITYDFAGKSGGNAAAAAAAAATTVATTDTSNITTCSSCIINSTAIPVAGTAGTADPTGAAGSATSTTDIASSSTLLTTNSETSSPIGSNAGLATFTVATSDYGVMTATIHTTVVSDDVATPSTDTSATTQSTYWPSTFTTRKFTSASTAPQPATTPKPHTSRPDKEEQNKESEHEQVTKKVEDKTVYELYLTTGTEPQAETDSYIYLIVNGDKGNFTKLLDNFLINDFTRGSTDVFKFTQKDVGLVTELKIRVCVYAAKNSWFLESLKLVKKTTTRGQTRVNIYRAIVKEWLSDSTGLNFFDHTPDERSLNFELTSSYTV